MRIATWNVNGLRARLEFVRHWLRARQPDVVGLQELKLTDEQFPHEAFEELGYRAASFGQKSWNGVAILAKEEPQVTQRGLPDQESFGSRLITAEVEGLSFTTVYCPNGKHLEHDDFSRKLAWFDALADHMAAGSRARSFTPSRSARVSRGCSISDSSTPSARRTRSSRPSPGGIIGVAHFIASRACVSISSSPRRRRWRA